MDANKLSELLDAKARADKVRQAGFCVMSDEETVSKDEASKAIMALYDVTMNPKPLMQAYRIYKKYVPVLLAHNANINDFDQALERKLETLDKTVGDRSNKRWTNGEDEWLIEQICKEDASLFEISTTLGRTPASVQARVTKLVGLHRLSEKIAGKFIGNIGDEHVEAHIDGTLIKEEGR